MLKILLVIGSFLGGTIGAILVSQYAPNIGLIDIPNHRSSHQNPTPKGGGIGILCVFLIVSLLIGVPLHFSITASVLSLFSLLGDRYDISPYIRLFIQLIAALTITIPFFNDKHIVYSLINIYVLNIVILLLFIIGTTNIYNFMDGINGLAGITGVVGFGLIAYYSYEIQVDTNLATLAGCMALACMGFLPLNLFKAKVFMGDIGSILLGFTFAVLVLLISNNLVDFICMVGFLFPFYADELTTMIIRLKNHEAITRPHRKHLYQLLANERNIHHWKVSMGYGVFQILVGISILLIRPSGLLWVLLLLMLYFIIFCVFTIHIRLKVNNLT